MNQDLLFVLSVIAITFTAIAVVAALHKPDTTSADYIKWCRDAGGTVEFNVNKYPVKCLVK